MLTSSQAHLATWSTWHLVMVSECRVETWGRGRDVPQALGVMPQGAQVL